MTNKDDSETKKEATQTSSEGKNQPLPPQKPCGLTRDEMACIKTALAVVVVKRRLQTKHSNKKKKLKAVGNPLAALKNVTGEGLFHRDDASLLSRRSLFSLSQPAATLAGSSTAALTSQLPLAFNKEKLGWAAHLQHVLKLALSSHHRSSNNSQGLAVHAACQIEQAAAFNDVSAWIKQQMIAAPSTADDESQDAISSWLTIWQNMVQVKPIVFAELLVPVLLDLLLGPKQTNSTADDTDAYVRLEPVHWLLVLEGALRKAPPHVLEKVSEAFQDSSNTNNKLLPCNNATWYSTCDLAYEYLTEDSPETFLLVHGLAEISEQLSYNVMMDFSNDCGQSGTFATMSTNE